jgi:hypothetical protein
MQLCGLMYTEKSNLQRYCCWLILLEEGQHIINMYDSMAIAMPDTIMLGPPVKPVHSISTDISSYRPWQM